MERNGSLAPCDKPRLCGHTPESTTRHLATLPLAGERPSDDARPVAHPHSGRLPVRTCARAAR
eukprot:759646-Prymnesium_polylepis.1